MCQALDYCTFLSQLHELSVYASLDKTICSETLQAKGGAFWRGFFKAHNEGLTT